MTVKILNYCSNNLIIRPLISIFKLFPISEKRILTVKKMHLKPTDNMDNGTNLNYAFSIMMWTFGCLILTIELLISKALENIELENNLVTLFAIAVFLSIVFNYLTLWKSDKYEIYFKKFKKEQKGISGVFLAIAYHLTITGLCFLTAINI